MQTDDGDTVEEIRQRCAEEHRIPAVWQVHLPVDELLESLRKVSEGGGQVIQEVDRPKYAIVRDPVGVYLALQAG